MNELAIVILSYNTQELTLECLKSIFDKDWKTDFAVYLVDNNSSDQTVREVKKKFPQVKIIESNKNIGFSAGNNLALKTARAKYYLLLNSDTMIKPHAIDNLVEFAKIGGYDICSCRLVDGEGNFQPNAGELPTLISTALWLSGLDDLLRRFISIPSYQERSPDFYHNDQEVGWVSGSVMLIKKSVFDNIGYLDENIFMYGEDVEFCLRAQKKHLRVGWTDLAEIVHFGGRSLDQPQYQQWLGEFKGLLYIYEKYYGGVDKWILKLFIYFFVFVRSLVFLLLGKLSFSKTYAKILINL